MATRTFVNTDYQTRTWGGIARQEDKVVPADPAVEGSVPTVIPAGATLELGPGETVDLDLPQDFEDPYLVPATPAPAAPSSSTSSSTTPPASPSTTPPSSSSSSSSSSGDTTPPSAS